jgi:chemotaxis family two-component system response regulator Rcp1
MTPMAAIPPSTRPLTILQVEDTPADVVLTAHALKVGDVPYSIHVVGDGKQALLFLQRGERYAEAPRPDLILLDLSLPFINGQKVLQFIKNHPSLKAIPVVVFTTLATDVSKQMAYDHHANSYMVKPTDFGQFKSMIQSIAAYWTLVSTLPSSRAV